MAINNITNNLLRFDGMATGLDTANIIKQLMTAEKIPLDKLNQKRTLLEWKRDNYRDITNTLRAFRDEFMDIVKPLTNMRSEAVYKKFSVTSSNSSIVSAVANSTAISGEHSITQIKSLASAANAASSAGITAALTGAGAAGFDFTGGNNQFNVTVDGVAKTISLRTSSAYADVDDLVNNAADGIQKLVNDAFGTGKVSVTADPVTQKLTFSSPANSSRITLSNAAANNALGTLNFATGSSNRINTGETLETLAAKLAGSLTFDGSNNVTFTINNIDFSFNKTQTLNDVITSVNSSSAGVELRYSELTDKISITAKTKGAGDNIVIQNTGGTLFGNSSALNISAVSDITSVANGTVNAGTDAEFTLDGVSVKRSDNVFTIDGITYTLNSIYNDPADPANAPVKITVNQDTEAIFDTIKSFVDKYNEVIDKINGELTEKYDRNYLPLSDEQKEEMTEEEIKLWEERAKTGLLRNDTILQKIVSDMRRSIYDSITDVTGGITDIGIATSSDYKDRGKLVIDETKLKEAIQSNPDKVQNIFSKTPAIDYSPDLSPSDRTQRYNEEGIVHRLYDIIQDSIRTTRNAAGYKGTLLEKAGVVGDITEFQNIIDKEINEKEQSISALLDRLARKEEYYYRMFTALEKAVSQMNSQSAWLMQQFSNNSQ